MSAIAIVACDQKQGIGKDGSIPWKTDLSFFKKMTTGHVVIMGRKTWESLNIQPLPDRVNIIVSNTLPQGRWKKNKSDKEYFYCEPSIGAALAFARDLYPDKEHFIIGGEQLYRSAFVAGLIDAVLLTKYAIDANCDTFFPMSIEDLEHHFRKFKIVDIDNDGEIPLFRVYYTDE
jgi:dihydrofolate reductase